MEVERALSELSAQELVAHKDGIEAEIKLQQDILEGQHSVGMGGPLVDKQGFPRADIDIYAVRTARNRVICLRNDHKEVMKLVEEKLHELHAKARESGGGVNIGSSSSSSSSSPPGGEVKGFATVNQVSDSSPAAHAGLKEGDVMVEFGSVKAANFRTLQDVGSIVQHSKGRPVRVVVQRQGGVVSLSLTPQPWAGRGLLGCHIVPL